MLFGDAMFASILHSWPQVVTPRTGGRNAARTPVAAATATDPNTGSPELMRTHPKLLMSDDRVSCAAQRTPNTRRNATPGKSPAPAANGSKPAAAAPSPAPPSARALRTPRPADAITPSRTQMAGIEMGSTVAKRHFRVEASPTPARSMTVAGPELQALRGTPNAQPRTFLEPAAAGQTPAPSQMAQMARPIAASAAPVNSTSVQPALSRHDEALDSRQAVGNLAACFAAHGSSHPVSEAIGGANGTLEHTPHPAPAAMQAPSHVAVMQAPVQAESVSVCAAGARQLYLYIYVCYIFIFIECLRLSV